MNWLPVVGLALTIAAPGAKDAPKKPAAPTIVGEWECTEFVAGRQKAAAEEAKSIGLECGADGKLAFRFGGQADEGTYTTDTAKDPAEVEYGTSRVAKKNFGIFKIEKDTLTF